MKKEDFEKAHVKQKHGVCVLTSYAVAAFPHVQKPVQEYMEAYCRSHGHQIQSQADAEKKVADTWDVDAAKAHENGYGHLNSVHKTVKEEPFKTAFDKIKLIPVNGAKAIDDVKAALKANPRLTAIVTLTPKNEPAHSIAVGYDEKAGGYIISNPNNPSADGPFSTFPEIRDSKQVPFPFGEAFLLAPV
jgi:hypothetical protein